MVNFGVRGQRFEFIRVIEGGIVADEITAGGIEGVVAYLRGEGVDAEPSGSIRVARHQRVRAPELRNACPG